LIGEPAPRVLPTPGTTDTGLDPRLAAALAYLIGAPTGALFILLERRNRFVCLHAFQSIVGLGGLWLAGAAVWGLAMLTVFVSVDLFRVLMWLADLIWIATAAAWLACLYKAVNGEWWRLPLAGRAAERWAERRSTSP
jgi:uncharacterized membrane protein